MSQPSNTSETAVAPSEVAEKLCMTSVQFFGVDASVTPADIHQLFEGFTIVEQPYRWACGPVEHNLFYWNVKLDSEDNTRIAVDLLLTKTLKNKPIECRVRAQRKVSVESSAIPTLTTSALPPPRQKGRPSISRNTTKQNKPAEFKKEDFPTLSTKDQMKSHVNHKSNGISYAKIAGTTSTVPSVKATIPAKPHSETSKKEKKTTVAPAVVALAAVVVPSMVSAAPTLVKQSPCVLPSRGWEKTSSPPAEEAVIIPQQQQQPTETLKEKVEVVKPPPVVAVVEKTVPVAAEAPSSIKESMWTKSFVQIIKEAPAVPTNGPKTTINNNNSNNADWRQRTTTSQRKG